MPLRRLNNLCIVTASLYFSFVKVGVQHLLSCSRLLHTVWNWQNGQSAKLSETCRDFCKFGHGMLRWCCAAQKALWLSALPEKWEEDPDPGPHRQAAKSTYVTSWYIYIHHCTSVAWVLCKSVPSWTKQSNSSPENGPRRACQFRAAVSNVAVFCAVTCETGALLLDSMAWAADGWFDWTHL